MGKYPKARVVPFSSVVGSSVTLHDPETERVIGQLGILCVGGDTPEDWRQRSILVAEDTAKRINCHDDLITAITEADEGIREAVRIMDLMGRGGDARNLALHGNNLRAALMTAGAQ
jgi:hypothetical protein